MIDFTSSLYLGLEHGSESLPGWKRLTLGKPAALAPVPGSRDAETELARLTGCERALLAPSTLHLFWDLFSILAARGVSIFLDQGAYPIARWGVERAATFGVPVRLFPHYDAQALQEAMEEGTGRPTVIVADGYCPVCGKAAPLLAYLELAKSRDGLVVIDDTQALGIFGRSSSPWMPYGTGGGGSLQRAGLRGPSLLLVSSLAKAFGVPVAVLSGSEARLSEYEAKSQTRVHCSPPSVAATRAATHALRINRSDGDSLRLRLGRRVARFREWLRESDMIATDSLFPLQSLRLPQGVEPRAVYETLVQRGVRTVLHRGTDNSGEHISFVITAQHTLREIDYAGKCLAAAGRQAIRTLQGGKANEKANDWTDEPEKHSKSRNAIY